MSPEFERWGPPAKRKKGAGRKGVWLALGLIGIAAAAVVFLGLPHAPREKPKLAALDGYQRDVAVLSEEYRRFHGKLLHDPELEHQFQLAAHSVDQKNLSGAIGILEAVAKEAAVPIIFNDLGTLYAALGDRARAIAAFREALARDVNYRPVRDNIERLRGFTADEADPVVHEIEPNNSNVVANLIGMNAAVDGAIVLGDVDTFRFITPAAPRDILQLQVENRTPTLELGIRAYDEALKSDSERLSAPPGESITRYLSQPPNISVYLQVWGGHDTTGSYKVTVHPLKAFDAFEPNDDIFNARRIDVGPAIEANIMDSEDTDFYSFESPRSGTVSIDVQNRSNELIPAITTFSSDRRNSGFGPDVRTPGTDLHHTMEVQQHQTYFIQIWSQARTAGKYSLTIH